MKTIKIRNLIIGEGIPKIAVSITGSTEKEIVEILDKIDLKKVDIVEWRGDFFTDILDMDKVLSMLKLIRGFVKDSPIIFTLRTKKEGGEKEISTDYYYLLNKLVAESRIVDMIDIEMSLNSKEIEELIKTIHGEGVFIVGSSHDFSKTPSKEKMIYKLNQIANMGADILKLAVMPKTSEDVLRLLKITNEMKNYTKKPIITISMGSLGIVSRISGQVFGSCITFGALDKKSAPGQIPVDSLFHILRIK